MEEHRNTEEQRAAMKRRMLRIVFNWLMLWLLFSAIFFAVSMSLEPTPENRKWILLVLYANIIPYGYLFAAFVKLGLSHK